MTEGGERPGRRAPRRPRVRPARAAGAAHVPLHRSDPAGARPRLERRHDRARPGGRHRRPRGASRPGEAARARPPARGHADNLAAALAGGVCLTWDGRIARIADDVPASRWRSGRHESQPSDVRRRCRRRAARGRRLHRRSRGAARRSARRRDPEAVRRSARRPAARAVPLAVPRRGPHRRRPQALGATLSGSGRRWTAAAPGGGSAARISPPRPLTIRPSRELAGTPTSNRRAT